MVGAPQRCRREAHTTHTRPVKLTLLRVTMPRRALPRSMMGDYGVELVNDSMQEFYAQLKVGQSDK